MSKFVITSDEIKDIHNGLCYLRNAIDRLEDTLSPFIIKELRKAKSEIEKGFKSARDQREDRWDEANSFFDKTREELKYTSVWSMYEKYDDMHKTAFFLEEGSVLVHENFSVPLPTGSRTWFDMWKAADEAIFAVGGDHIFIESFTQSSINPKIILLGTGS
jgi:hypothetical protein